MSAEVENLIPDIIKGYNLLPNDYAIERIGTGHIHHTFKLIGKKSYILQRVNKNIFRVPEIIVNNIRIASDFLKKKFPNYLFLSIIENTDGEEMIYDYEGFPWRLFPYLHGTFTIDKVANADEARSAATEFARLTKYLDGIETKLFQPTISRFHDLGWRYEQLEAAIKNASADRLRQAEAAIQKAKAYKHLTVKYKSLIESGVLTLRITHNDTKINNILFDQNSCKAVCVIDLDTLMPGYFIYDLGDMIRTFVSPADEEEKDLSKIQVRKDIYKAVVQGYLSQMDTKLTSAEKLVIPYSGMMMTYIMAIRMLADFLNGDIYYHTTYFGQNLVRAQNQLKLLDELNKLDTDY